MSETECEFFLHKSFNNACAQANSHPKPGYQSSLKSFALQYISCVEMWITGPGRAQRIKCKGHLTSHTHTEHSTFLSEDEDAVLSVLQLISSHGFDCHKKCEFNPLQVAGVC